MTPYSFVATRRSLLLGALIIGIHMNAHAQVFGLGGTSWEEEALLHDGSRIIVERFIQTGGRHELGQKPPIREQSLSFSLPISNERVVWEDNFAEDIGSANFMPMLLEVRQETAYLVVHPMGKLSHKKWGQPNPPYVVFQYRDKEWRRIPLEKLPPEFERPNLIFGNADEEAAKTGRRLISAETIRRLYEEYRQPEFKMILRAPIDRWKPRTVHPGPQLPHPLTPSK